MDILLEKIVTSPWSNYDPDWDFELNDVHLIQESLKCHFEDASPLKTIRIVYLQANNALLALRMMRDVLQLVSNLVLDENRAVSFPT